jgi:hypothetical protein
VNRSRYPPQLPLYKAEHTATGIRTPVSAVRGRRPSPLDDGGSWRAILATRFPAARSWGYSVGVHFRPVVQGSPVQNRRGPATVNGR